LRDRDGVAAYSSVDGLLEDDRVEAVVVDTPVATHVPLALAALRSGRHVCCEKPLALSRAEAGELNALARDRGVALFTAFHRRYNRNLPKPGTLPSDEPELVEVRYLERIEEHAGDLAAYAAPAEDGGGCIVDNGSNAVDVVHHLFGPASVDEALVERSSSGVDMRATVRGRLRGGAEVVIHLDWAFDGELKDLRVRWPDQHEVYADMLEGFPGFKSSLEHEYAGVLDAFAAQIASGAEDHLGSAATAWLEDVLARAPSPLAADARAAEAARSNPGAAVTGPGESSVR
jgi:predicted dehydrogenase